ncbi:uncharacterized protein [Choristoneura fumiferana]|uniref:uncharacterized protein n=1 Tax=Choristoneura fumiferana TaxID=7141 RepID=UPI003D15E254
MEPKTELPIKLPDMVSGVLSPDASPSPLSATDSDPAMCGDHPSLTKTELNAKEPKDEKDSSTSYSKLSPQFTVVMADMMRRDKRVYTQNDIKNEDVQKFLIFVPHGASRAGPRGGSGGGAGRGSEPALAEPPRTDARRRPDAPGNGALVQAALGSFRWPPYLLAVWVLVLVLTHALHCLVSVLERALPRLRQLCQYFRNWAESTWKAEHNTGRLFPIALAFLTGLLYAFYFAIYTAYSIALWSIEPLSTEGDSKHPSQEAMETKVTDYVDEHKSDASLKQ